MPQVLVLQVDYEVVQELSGHRIGEDVTVIFFREVVYVLNDCIINGGILCRLASASLFKHFPGEGSEVDSFKWFRLAEVVNVVLAYLDGRDLGKCM
jgi:hypothetical protein